MINMGYHDAIDVGAELEICPSCYAINQLRQVSEDYDVIKCENCDSEFYGAGHLIYAKVTKVG